MGSNTLCIVTYGTINGTNLCNLRLIHINKSHAEICCFTALHYYSWLGWPHFIIRLPYDTHPVAAINLISLQLQTMIVYSVVTPEREEGGGRGRGLQPPHSFWVIIVLMCGHGKDSWTKIKFCLKCYLYLFVHSFHQAPPSQYPNCTLLVIAI